MLCNTRGKKSNYKSEEIDDISLNPDGTIDLTLETGEIINAEAHDGYDISKPIPLFRFDGSDYDSNLAMEYYCPELKNRIHKCALTQDLLGDTSLWGGEITGEFGKETGDLELISETMIPKILSKVQFSIKGIPIEGGKEKRVIPNERHLTNYLGIIAKEKPEINRFMMEWIKPTSEEIFSNQYRPEDVLKSCGARFPARIDPEEEAAYLEKGSLG